MSLALLFHYLLLNMFRMSVHLSSGACDLLWIYFMCCIALVRCVLVLRCGSAGVVWYPYAGWSLHKEQFQLSVDTNPSVSQINKHVFLRGYLEGKPKHLVDGIAVTAETYEETKLILHTKYGDKNRIIRAHLDYLEDLKSMRSATPELLNTTYVERNRRL